MAVKPENTFISAVHKHLPKDVYRMKNNNPYVAGIPDCYYSGSKGDLWVEYKFIPKLPVRVPVTPEVSALQAAWLLGRHKEGRNVALIVGSPEGGVVFRVNESFVVSSEIFRSRIKSRATLAEWIVQQTNR